MSQVLMIIAAGLVVLVGSFGFLQLSLREQAENKLRKAEATASEYERVAEQERTQRQKAEAAAQRSAGIEQSIATRSERSTDRAVLIATRPARVETKATTQEKRSHDQARTADLDDCVDPVVISLLNAERADFPGARPAGGDAGEGQAPAACVTVRDLAEADRAAVASYNTVAERHNALVDEVTSRHSTPSHSKSSHFTSHEVESSQFSSSHFSSGDYSASDSGSSDSGSSSSDSYSSSSD